MGRKYKEELKELAQTYLEVIREDVSELNEFLGSVLDSPLLLIGSGGSLTTACFMSILHQNMGQIAKFITPFEFISMERPLNDCTVLLLSAMGNNPDIVNSLQFCIKNEFRRVMIICTNPRSKLVKLSSKFSFIKVIILESFRKDGFLATNSLLLMLILLSKAYSEALDTGIQFPKTLTELMSVEQSFKNFEDRLEGNSRDLLEKDTLFVLYDYWSKPAALYLESAFIEAGLGNIQITDYRNFGHGRHNWLDKRKNTGLLALATGNSNWVVEKTLELVPSYIPILLIRCNQISILSAIVLIIKSMYLVNIKGRKAGIDPGRPEVPVFGEKIYELNCGLVNDQNPLFSDLTVVEKVVISRKIGSLLPYVTTKVELNSWVNAYGAFIQKIKNERFSGIVFDYDGTLCDPSDRKIGIPEQISEKLNFLANNGILIGIATGRGKSVRKDLQEKILEENWGSFTIGYYNGSDIGLLSNDECPNKKRPVEMSLKRLKRGIDRHFLITRIATIDMKPEQISIRPKRAGDLDNIKNMIYELVSGFKNDSFSILQSGHSLDVVVPSVSKISVVKALEKKLIGRNNKSNVLCIGDSGKWPGNDFYLLKHPYSLSVDEVSTDLATCWNLAFPGYRWVQATMFYLDAIVVTNGMFVINTSKLIDN